MYNEEIPYMIESIDELPPEGKRDNWYISFGLQAVDGLAPSEYIRGLAENNISGDKTYAQVADMIEEYYSGKNADEIDEGEREADIVSLHMSLVLAEKAFTYSPVALCGIHRRLFTGVFVPELPVGEYRSYNISKAERVLSGESVLYSSADMIRETLAYDFENEKKYDYAAVTTEEQAFHMMGFISGIWQIHPFAEGNTRTCAVFAIQYLRSLGFSVDNEPFCKHSQYFRDALVLDNCGRNKKPDYLKVFTENLLLGGGHELGGEIPAIAPG